jgi:hypothetical protein
MTNVQQPEMRRSETNPTVQDSKEPGPGGPPRTRGEPGRPVPPDQVSPHGPASRPVASRGADDEEAPEGRGAAGER